MNQTALTAVLRHRGPDDHGEVLVDKGVFLGHTRLAIIDLSEAGHQPMSTQEETIWITFNGEIFNFTDLRGELEQAGHKFRSRTDTEVILHGYEEWGMDLLSRLNGMFAFAIYDKRKKLLFLARDHLGIKPLYYTIQRGYFAFASEIKALFSLLGPPRKVNWQAIFDYFSFLYVPCPQTAYQDIFQLPPGHYLTYDLKNVQPEIKRYCNVLRNRRFGGDREKRCLSELQRGLRDVLNDSLKRQLNSDVPLGIFLSGGIDSTILTGLASHASSDPVRTFTVLFEGDGIAPYDETHYARGVSRHFNTDHKEVTVSLSRPEELLDLASCFDQPFANPTFYLSYLISKKTREYVSVALSGAGGDELFGGYPRYRALPYSRILRAVPSNLYQGVAALLDLLPESYEHQSVRRIKLLARGIGQDFPEQYLRWTYFFSDEEKRKLLSPLLRKVDGVEPSVRIVEQYLIEAEHLQDLSTRVQYVDLRTFLADNILEYTDKTSMAASLEVRVPFLDYRVVELSFQIPWEYKIKKGISKYILKEAFRDLLPKKTLEGPKRGFCPPLATWMRRSLDSYFDEQMGRNYVEQEGIFDWEVIQRLRADHKNRRRDNSMELFGIIIFDVWWRKYLDVNKGRM